MPVLDLIPNLCMATILGEDEDIGSHSHMYLASPKGRKV